jgi:aminocarboxymuconate-semialdehyde decarboxylase
MSQEWFIVDGHSHFIPREAISLIMSSPMGKRMMGFGLGGSASAGPMSKTLDIEGKLKVMEEAGVDMAVIHMAALNMVGLEFCAAMNNGNARVAREYPDKIVPLAHVPLETGPEVMKELDRAINELGLRGVALESSSDKYTLGSPVLTPLFEKINSLGVPVVIHPANFRLVTGGSTASALDAMHNINMATAVEEENAKAATELLGGVLPKFPELKVVLSHHGGGMPLLLGRMMFHFLPEGFVLPDKYKTTLPRTRKIRKELGLDEAFMQLFSRMYFDTAGFMGWMPITQATLLTVKPQRMAFGTDYPLEMIEAEDIKAFIDDIKALPIPEADRRAILGDTARELFKIL